MINKQRGIIDPWTLGFLISLVGLTVTQPWEIEAGVISNSSLNTEGKISTVQRKTQHKSY